MGKLNNSKATPVNTLKLFEYPFVALPDDQCSTENAILSCKFLCFLRFNPRAGMTFHLGIKEGERNVTFQDASRVDQGHERTAMGVRHEEIGPSIPVCLGASI